MHRVTGWKTIFYIKRIAVISIVLLFAIVQTTALDTLSLFGIKPDILLLVVVFFGLKWGWLSGFMIGLLSGFAKDIFSGTLLGANFFSSALTGVVAGWLGRWFYAEISLAQILLSFLIVIINHFLYFVVLHPLPLYDAIRFVILPASAYTALFSVPIFFILGKISLWD